MVITVEIEKFAITKVLVDQGSSINILYWKTFNKMRIAKSEIQPYEWTLEGILTYILHSTKVDISAIPLKLGIFLLMPILHITSCSDGHPSTALEK